MDEDNNILADSYRDSPKNWDTNIIGGSYFVNKDGEEEIFMNTQPDLLVSELQKLKPSSKISTKYFSELKNATSYKDFTSSTWEEFFDGHDIIIPYSYLWTDKDFLEFGEKYYSLIPRTYKKAFPSPEAIHHLLDIYSDKKEDLEPLKEFIENINAAVEKDRKAFRNHPSLPGLGLRERKPGALNSIENLEHF